MSHVYFSSFLMFFFFYYYCYSQAKTKHLLKFTLIISDDLNVLILSFLSLVRLPQPSRCRRNKTQDTNPDLTSMERARQHHESKLLLKAMAAWRNYQQQCHKNKVVSVLSFAPILPTSCLNIVLSMSLHR